MSDKLKVAKKIGYIYISFWIIPIMITMFSLFFTQIPHSIKSVDNSNVITSFSTIFFRNISIYFIICLLGFINRFLPFILYYYNAIIFSLVFCISISRLGTLVSILRVVPHGTLEVLGFAISTFIGANIKLGKLNRKTIKLLVLGGCFILLAAIIESNITSLFV